ncbi:potassium channel family protein [Pseudomonas sp. N040]|uniref:potassium channel family protein n=1 Tax=Pseudomonas sp. N040 TaxID=2785325 RepID=UPI0018A27B5A|nr:potassium channel family protein [Pseudomonas sp. N040]MBF7731653.1 two pore domain potassium channel family protein [Pseudomonas sp. N040]MBW7015297.1 potassium channel family protein [Pseudomonas sp. N040]
MLHTLRIRFRFRLLLASTLLLIIAMLCAPNNQHAVFVGMLFLVLAGVNALPRPHLMQRAVLILGIVVLLLKALTLLGILSYHISNFGMAGLYALLFSALIHRLTRQRPVTGELLYGLVAIYLQIALLFAILYDGIEIFRPGSFVAGSGIAPLEADDFTYFSLITLTTVGYGDIYPIHPLARLLVTFEAVTGVMFIGLSMARSLMLIADDSVDELNNG